MYGNRRFADDPAVVGGIALLEVEPVTVIAVEKGHTAKERSRHNFGVPNPEGYHKAPRLMKQAKKFGRPVVCFVDTSGAFCSIVAEERGQGQAVAENLMEMSTLCVPIAPILIGEGGSGCALVPGVADHVWILQKRRLFDHIAGVLRQHPLERRRLGRRCCRKPESDGRGRKEPGRNRAHSLRKRYRPGGIL